MDPVQGEFRRLVEDWLIARGGDFEPVTEHGCFVEIGETLLQLLLERDRREVTLSVAVFDGLGDTRYLVPEIIADFNAAHLLDDGCCMLVEEEFAGLYVSRHDSLDGLAAAGLGHAAEDFAGRAEEWRDWYRRAAEPFWPAARPD